jgi:hypothetical protein
MVTVNFRRVPADLVQMQLWQFAIGYDGDIPVSRQFSPDCRLDLVQRFLRRRLIKSDGDAVVLRIQADLPDRRVIRDQPGYARPRLMVCFCGRPIRHWILVHGELFPAIAHIISAVFVIHSAFLGSLPQSQHKK